LGLSSKRGKDTKEHGKGKELASLAHIINILNIILVLSSSLDWCCHVAAVSACADAASAAAAAV